MAEPKNEQLSALTDGELSGAELARSIDRLSADSDLRERWGRYQMIGDVLNGRRALPEADGLHARVAAAIADETPILAPRRGVKTMPPFFRRAAGFAMAASVSAVAILGVQELSDAPVEEAGGGMVRPGSGGIVAQAERDPEMRSRLNPYLVHHNEYSASTRMQGILPYARVVSHAEF